MIKVSVIIPIYSVPLDYLRICLSSLAEQTMLESEFIIVSDGAPNAERLICNEFIQKDSRFRFFQQEHQGVAATKQFGLDKANGEYVTFVDSDDWVEQNYLNEIYKIAVENSLEILNWDYRLFPATNQIPPLLNHSITILSRKEKELFLNNILINQNFGQSLSSCCTRLYKTSFVRAKKITFNRMLSIGEDKAFNYQAYVDAERLGYVNKTYYNYRTRADSAVHKFIPNSLPIYLKYITYIASFCLPQNKNSLGKEFLNVFFHSLDHSYFPTNKKIAIRESLSNLRKNIASKDFQQALQLLKGQKLSLQMQLYLFCLRKRILFPIYKKGLVYYFQREKECFFKNFLHPLETIVNIVSSHPLAKKTLCQKKFFEQRANSLTKKAFQSTVSGIASEMFCDEEIIVSLTSYGKRIYDVYLAIESIMQGTIKPNRIILWLSEEEFSKKTLPQTLQKQMKRGLEIRFCKDIKSYKKIIFSLKEFPNASIITIDDDLIYNPDLVKNLIKSHKKNPNCICANRIHEITFDENKQIKSYLQWNWNSKKGSNDPNNNFFTSGGGTLFPPCSLHNDVFNEETFMAICPTADDVWLNAMARLNHSEILKSFTHDPGGDDFLVNEQLQADGLGTINNNLNDCKNDTQIKSVFEKYNILIH